MNKQPIASSNIFEAGYDEKEQLMEVDFINGGIYRYTNVPKSVWEAFLAANTPGEYFYHFIRSSYPYYQIGGGQGKGKGKKK